MLLKQVVLRFLQAPLLDVSRETSSFTSGRHSRTLVDEKNVNFEVNNLEED